MFIGCVLLSCEKKGKIMPARHVGTLTVQMAFLI